MSALSIQVPFPVFNDRDGQPLDNGYVWIGVPNLPPQTNPVNVYFDDALTILAPQPLRTINGYISRAGSPAQVYIDGVNFSILVQDSKGSMVYNFPEGTGISPNASGVAFTGFKGQVGFVSDLADDDGSDWIGFEPSGSGAVARSAQDKLRETISMSDFGALGDGTNQTTAIKNAFAAAANKTLLFDCANGNNYFCADEIEILDGCDVNLNGATLQFFQVGQKQLFLMNSVSNVILRNGTIHNTGGTGGLSLDGWRQSIRAFNINNCTFKDLTFAHGLGNLPAIAVYGNSYNILVENISTEQPSGFGTVGTVFICHWWWNTPTYDKLLNDWTVVNALYGVSNPEYVTTNHPHNIAVKNINSDQQGERVIWVSSSFNVSIENVWANTKGGIIVYPGDYGQDFARPEFVGKVSKNITVTNANLYGGLTIGMQVTANGASPDLGACTPVPAQVSVNDSTFFGSAALISGFGLLVSGAVNTVVTNTRFSAWQFGVAIGNETYNLTVRDCAIDASKNRGVSIAPNAGFPARKITIDNCIIAGNNTDDDFLDISSGIYITNVIDLRVINNTFGGIATENQVRSTYSTTTNGPVLTFKLANNHTYNVRSTGSVAHSTQTADGIVTLIENNTSNTTSIYSGDYFYQITAYGKKRFVFDAASGVPTSGTWTIGDSFQYRNPTAGGFIGGVCTATGTPGTWKTYGVISA
jgi:hypothetical protein